MTTFETIILIVFAIPALIFFLSASVYILWDQIKDEIRFVTVINALTPIENENKTPNRRGN